MHRDWAGEIVNIYRALRKGQEDNKYEPGAADFYYGEMELRRKATRASVERVILSAYWLVSGYGLRAWRSVTAIFVTLAVFGLLMVTIGFQVPTQDRNLGQGTTPIESVENRIVMDTSFIGAVILGARTAIGLPRTPTPALTRWGDTLQILLRVILPVLLGLSVLSIRSRVKR